MSIVIPDVTNRRINTHYLRRYNDMQRGNNKDYPKIILLNGVNITELLSIFVSENEIELISLMCALYRETVLS